MGLYDSYVVLCSLNPSVLLLCCMWLPFTESPQDSGKGEKSLKLYLKETTKVSESFSLNTALATV